MDLRSCPRRGAVRRRGPRVHLLLLNVLYLAGGAAGFALAWRIVHRIFGIGMTSKRVLMARLTDRREIPVSRRRAGELRERLRL